MTSPRAKKAVKAYTRWAVVGKNGLYVGQEQTRQAMINVHCRDWIVPWEFYPAKASVKDMWARRRKAGDRVVKIRIQVISK